MPQPIHILRYLYGDTFNQDIAITYVDYLDLVARWDVTIDPVPPTLLAYTDAETLISDAYGVFQLAYTRVSNYFDTLLYSNNIGSFDAQFLSQIIDAIQKQKVLIYLTKDEDDFSFMFGAFGQSTLVLNAAYFTGFTNYTDLVTLFNVYDYKQLMSYGYEWLYEVGQFLGETFTIVDARDMLVEVYDNEIKDLTYPLPDISIPVAGTVIIDTYANIQTLATGGLLKLENTYQINDNTDAEGGDVVLKPISLSKFSKTADYIPSFDSTQRWACVYDFDGNAIIELRDEINNTVISNSAINNFVWGNANVSGNYIDSPTTLTFTNVNIFQDNIISKKSIVVIDSDGSIINNYIGEECTFDITDVGVSTVSNNRIVTSSFAILSLDGGTIQYNIISSNSTLDISNTGFSITIQYNEFRTGSYVVIVDSSVTMLYNFSDASTFTITDYVGGSLSSTRAGYSTITVTNNSGTTINNNSVDNNSVFEITNSTNGQVNRNNVNSASTFDLDSLQTGAEVNSNTVESVGVLNNTSTISGRFVGNRIGSGATVSLTTAHAGEMDYNEIRGRNTVTVGANAGIAHNRNIIAIIDHAFTAGVNESNTRVND